MKVLDEYVLMVVFMMLLNRVHVSGFFVFNSDRAVKEELSDCMTLRRPNFDFFSEIRLNLLVART